MALQSIADQLLACGYQFFSNEKQWIHALSKHLGVKRFKRFEEQVNAVQSGHLAGRNLYDTLYKLEDFTLVLSRDLGTLIQVYDSLLKAISNHSQFREGWVIDLGCGIAPLHGFMSRELEINLIGVDTSGNALIHASDLNPQSRFYLWDYQKSPCLDLPKLHSGFCVFGVDFQSLSEMPPEGVNQFAPYLSRQSQYHLQRKEEAYQIWENWDPSFERGAVFIQILRMAWFDHFVAWVEVAQELDWRIQTLSWIQTDEERFPQIQWIKDELTAEWGIKEMIFHWGREI
jgi:hypothetical protein